MTLIVFATQKSKRAICASDLEREQAELVALLMVRDADAKTVAPEEIARAQQRVADKELELHAIDTRLKRTQTMVRR